MTDILQYEFFRNALWGIMLISISSALLGTYIFARRLVGIAGGITHACFGGLGLGYFLGINPILMAGVFAVGSSLGVDYLAERQKIREDSAIAVVWALGMAVGVLFVFLTPGFVPELNSFLFGNILTITRADLLAFALFTIVVLAVFTLWFAKIIAVAFDRDFARVIGLHTKTISALMTVLVAICIVLTIKLVGVMLLMSMLSLPQMIAETRFHSVKPLMVASAIVSLTCCVAGLLLATVIDVPCSALIVIIMAAMFLTVRAASHLLYRHKSVKRPFDNKPN